MSATSTKLGLLTISALAWLGCKDAPAAQAEVERGRAVQIAAVEERGQPAAGKAEGERGAKRGFVGDIEALAEGNPDFRRVLYTGKNMQLVVMAIPPGDHIGLEKHDVDQFFRIEEGEGEVVIDGRRSRIGPGSGILVPAGATHDVLAKGETPLKVYSLYAPPEHRDGIVHPTREAAEARPEHFDGETTE